MVNNSSTTIKHSNDDECVEIWNVCDNYNGNDNLPSKMKEMLKSGENVSGYSTMVSINSTIIYIIETGHTYAILTGFTSNNNRQNQHNYNRKSYIYSIQSLFWLFLDEKCYQM